MDFKRREHSMRADLGLLKEARDFAERAAADFGLAPNACYDVKLAMSEAVTNAIQHGSTSPRDPIRIAVLAEGHALVFEVRTRGASSRASCAAGSCPSPGAASSSCEC
jgi:anti-sigma regulatory factor (Ser/Thr protein kinase)